MRENQDCGEELENCREVNYSAVAVAENEKSPSQIELNESIFWKEKTRIVVKELKSLVWMGCCLIEISSTIAVNQNGLLNKSLDSHFN
ncbi:hypothetical protein [Nostoc punctiforme]|uniref:hypothetical protein n=1 Tax=Nostoc punctiforme TaxID=272131 RepID=UPI000045C190|nr:hypothetical protein [Nostoc punctiforme]